MKPVDVLCLTYHDWANSGWRYAQCLKNLGLNVIAYKGAPHHFEYPEQIAVHTGLNQGTVESQIPLHILSASAGLRNIARNARVIHYFASTFVECGVDLTGKKVVVQHGGTMYRNNADACNAVFNQYAAASVIQYPTLLNLGAKNEHLIYYPVDTDFIMPSNRPLGKRLRVGHFPSSKDVKGTDVIMRAIERLESDTAVNGRLEYIGLRNETTPYDMTDWMTNLWRLVACDIVIETCRAEFQGKPFGEWGNTALEAAAMGKIVVTNSLNVPLYNREYGELALEIANDEVALETKLRELLSLSDGEIAYKQGFSRGWAEKYHSIPATATRLWNLVYRDLMEGA